MCLRLNYFGVVLCLPRIKSWRRRAFAVWWDISQSFFAIFFECKNCENRSIKWWFRLLFESRCSVHKTMYLMQTQTYWGKWQRILSRTEEKLWGKTWEKIKLRKVLRNVFYMFFFVYRSGWKCHYQPKCQSTRVWASFGELNSASQSPLCICVT